MSNENAFRWIVKDTLALRSGLVASSIAAVVASLINLPLHAPTDAFFNSASVTVGSLATGIGVPLLWSSLRDFRRRHSSFAIAIIAIFCLVLLASLVSETNLERSVSYIVPLAALVLGLTGIFTVLLLPTPFARSWRLTLIALLIAVGLGIGLAGQGDQKSGRLELPPRAASTITLNFSFLTQHHWSDKHEGS